MLHLEMGYHQGKDGDPSMGQRGLDGADRRKDKASAMETERPCLLQHRDHGANSPSPGLTFD